MPDTSKATEARKASALARREQQQAEQARNSAEQNVLKRYGNFLPANTVDPIGVYKLWQKSIFGDEEPDDTIMYFVVAQAKAAGIDARVPRQIYAIPYNRNIKMPDGSWRQEKQWTVIVGIEGLTTIAENTGQYGGCTKPEYEFGTLTSEQSFGEPDYNKIISCSIGVHKIVQGVQTTSYQTIYFDEYTTDKNLWTAVGKKNDKGKDIGGKPKSMIKKVALAHALRATFSACAGLYVAEEVERQNIVDGELVTPDIKDDIAKITSIDEIKQLMSGLSTEDKKRVAPLITEKLKELP
jgi:hypothetical protein